MEIVIKLTDRALEFVKENGIKDIYGIEEAICNGIVLPKGHGRLIDADDLLRYIDTMPSWLDENGWRMIRRIRLTEYIQDSLPTIIEADKEVDE